MNTTAKQEKPRNKRNLPSTMRFAVLGVLIILFLYSAASAYTAYQAPIIKRIVTPVIHYDHNGRFDYIATLKNNTVYNNKTTLYPGEGTFFKQLISQVNVTFTDIYQIDQDANITGNYTVDAILQTNLWTKTYPLVPQTAFTSQGRTAQFTTTFPVNTTYYEDILTKINDETGIIAQNPLLIFQCTILVFATSANGSISSVFSPSINVSLNQKTLEFSKELTSYQSGVLTTTSIITKEEIRTQQIIWTALSLLFLGSIPLFIIMTKGNTTTETRTHKELKKMKKKYGEWLVETKTHPELANTRRIEINSLEDLAKVSEEIGKPILMYASPIPLNHRFYVLDETTMYEYLFRPKEEKHSVMTTNQSTTAQGMTHPQEIKKKQKLHHLLFSDRKHL